MSATAPARGPVDDQPISYTNGYGRTNGYHTSSGIRTSWAGSQHSSSSFEEDKRSEPKYPHINDLYEKARQELSNELKVSVHSSMNTLIDQAQKCAKKADSDITFKRLDRAYIEWWMSSQILCALIPRHIGYPDLNQSRGDQLIRYRALIKQNNALHDRFVQIHDTIVADNKRSGIRPLLGVSASSNTDPRQSYRPSSSPRPLSMPERSEFYNGEKALTERGGQPSVHAGLGHNRTRRISPVRPNSQQSRDRPPVHAKPATLHALPPSRSVKEGFPLSSADVLAERFAQLRTSPTSSRAPLPYPVDDGLIDLASAKPSQDARPSGPRAMPPSTLPPLPPKLPLDTRLVSSLPRAPSPTYSPARNLQSHPSTTPPLGAEKVMGNNGGRITRTNGSIPSYTSPYTSGGNEGAASSYSGERSRLTPSTKPNFQELPNATAVSAKELRDLIRSSSILLIDVRSREEYDSGHIFANSIICIEPLSLRSGTSAEDLEDRLVVSPESEELLFKRRDDFDLVVYYDQRTSSNHFLEGPPHRSSAPALRALHESLLDFNYNRKLQRPPAVLLGGLEAWIDLMGPQSLLTSRTTALMGTARSRRPLNGAGRAVGRTSMVAANSSREVQRRRLRDYNPLDADEERVWLEKARQEEVEPAEYQGQSDGDTDSNSSHPDEPPSPYVTTYEEFMRRFPEPSNIQESMIGFRQGPLSRHASSIPAIPSRPPPAVPRPSYSGVSERDLAQLSPASRQPPSSQTPLYMSRSVAHYLKLPRTGLINFGVTCYMNATVQCLLATIPLSQFFLDNRWRGFTQKNWKGSNGIMPEIYANLIRSLWRNDVQAVRPSSFRKFCTRMNREWGIERQQDAKEFLEFLVDCLHEDLNVNFNRSPLTDLTTEQELRRERMPVTQVSKIEWDRYSHREQSFISTLFAGQHASRLRCTTCNNTSTTFEAFYSISVEIPRSGRGDIRECLRSYCQEEMLSGDEVWKCPYCKCEREATKRITLTRLPQVLVIHFKRFSASKTESARKVHTPIEFPLYGLKMEPYMAPTQVDPTVVGDGVPDPAITPPFQYEAYAVMRHLGQTGSGGHYISLVKDQARGCWRKFDDDRATDFDPNKLRPEHRLQNEQAYIVFYGRSAAR